MTPFSIPDLIIIGLLTAILFLVGPMSQRVNDIHRLLKESPMATENFQELVEAVEHATTVKQAALELIRDMGDRLADLANHPSPEEIRALSEKLRENADALADGISEHDT